MKLFFLIIFASSISIFIYAQEGNVEIIHDSRLDALVEKQGEIVPPAVKPQIEGFRIQLFFDSDRSRINDAKAKFLNQFPKIDTYISYNPPNFFLKVGDFRTRLEAERIKSELEAEFPTSFVIKEAIYLPRLEKEELQK